MNEKLTTAGAAAAAFVASLCCLGPLLLGGVGLSAALLASFAPLRPYFLAVSAVLLAGGFYFAYRKPKAAEGCEGQVCAPESRTRRMAKPLLWIATVAVLALALFPWYGGRLVGATAVTSPAAGTTVQTAELKISGMVCEACAGVVKRRLLETPGVAAAEVDYPGGRATVKYDPAKTDPNKLAAAVNATGYKALVVNP
jgi:copper chaperone CopZ